MKILISEIKEVASDIKANYSLILWVLLLAFIAHAYSMMQPTFSNDDWHAWIQGSIDPNLCYGNGRWLMRVIWLPFDDKALSPFFTYTLGLVLIIISALLAAKVWGFKSRAAIFSLLLIASTHTVLGDVFSYDMNHVPVPAALLFACMAAYYATTERYSALSRGITTVLLLTMTLSTYQPQFLVFLIIITGLQLVKIYRGDFQFKSFIHWSLRISSQILIAAVIYAICVVLTWKITGVGPRQNFGRYDMTSNYIYTLADFTKNAIHAFSRIFKFWFSYTPHFPLTIKILSSILLFTSILLIFEKLKNLPSKRYFHEALTLIFTSAMLFIPFAIQFTRLESGFRYSTFCSIAFLTAFAAGMILNFTRAESDNGVRAFVITIISILYLSFSFHLSKATYSQVLSNQRDFHTANRLISQLSTMPEYELQSKDVRVSIIGKPKPAIMGRPFPELNFGEFYSSLACMTSSCDPKHFLRAMNLVNLDGHFFKEPFGKFQNKEVNEIINKMPKWPARKSIQYHKGVFIIKFS